MVNNNVIMGTGKLGCGTWIRTKIDAFKGHSPTIRRSRKVVVKSMLDKPIVQ